MVSSINNSTKNNQKYGTPKLDALPAAYSYVSLPDISDRHFWDSLPSDYKRERLTLSEKAMSASWPEILMSDYLRFSKDGNRVLFEEKFFTRRRMLTQLVMGECIENKGRFLPKIIDGLYLILGETTWCLPAHNSYIRDTKQYTYPDTSRPVVDLFAAETAAILAVAEKLLRPILKDISSFISSTIDSALYERVLSPYLHFHFWWKGNGLEPMCNWTPWITQNILLTAFTRPNDKWCKSKLSSDDMIHTGETGTADAVDDTCSDNCEIGVDFTLHAKVSKEQLSNRYIASPQLAALLCDENGLADPPDWSHRHLLPTQEELSEIYASAVSSVHHFLKEYAEDGCCDEGAQYYSHAGLCLFGCLSLLKDISGIFPKISEGSTSFSEKNYSKTSDGSLSSSEYEHEFSKDKAKIQNIATYIMKVHVGDNYYVNFADCSPHAGRRGAREYLFGELVSEPGMMDFAAMDYQRETWSERLQENEENLWYHVLNAKCHEKMMKRKTDSYTSSLSGDETSLAASSFIARSPAAVSKNSDTFCTGDAWFPSTGLMVTRDSHFVLAVKAGDNADSHNHNDVGSFILYKNNKPFIIDLGVGSYTKKTFSKDRYDIWTMQSQYHNLPSFYDADGRLLMEHDGAEFRATDVSCHMDESRSQLSMELQAAYPGLDGTFTRSVSLRKNSANVNYLSSCADISDGPVNTLTAGVSATDTPASTLTANVSDIDTPVIINDYYNGKLKLIENIICYEKPEIIEHTKDSSHIIRIGDTGTLLAEGFSTVRIEDLPITDARLGETWKHSCYRIQLTASEKTVMIGLM